eukprot:CAMPEP_0173194708 /NCGR_PEP_ID=MMETSP1141-20130122/14655_1 /TAXON_ID=483371 /ORGANISM="non described non described, Strain CCMP2298" /LENGTH=153 /DNA_ID=CAMNT_0014119167 /DNA_START=613 /DNA_END=1073 /DNA_ORIENTATION=-
MAKKSPFDPPLPESPAKISTMAPMLTTAADHRTQGQNLPQQQAAQQGRYYGVGGLDNEHVGSGGLLEGQSYEQVGDTEGQSRQHAPPPQPLEFAHYVAPTGHADAHQRGYAEDRVTVEDDCEVRNAVDFAQQQRIGRQRQDTKDGEEGAFDSI